MIVQLIEDDAAYTKIVFAMFANVKDVSIRACVRLDELNKTVGNVKIDLLLVDIKRPDSLSLKDDFQILQGITPAPIVFFTHGDTSLVRDEALKLGAEAVIDKTDLSEGLVRQLILNARSRVKSSGKVLSRSRIKPADQMSGGRNLKSLRAPFAYLESGLATLGDVMRETGKPGSSQFIEHLLETIQAITQYTQDDLSTQTGGSLHLLLQQSLERIHSLALTRKINLKVDWEEAGFRQIGSDALVQLGVQHLLEGILRCCAPKDGIWMQGEKAEETGSSVIRVHMSRRVLPSSDILFPNAKPSDGVGLDALSSMQLGGLLLMLSPKQVQLSTEDRQQMLSVFL